MLEMQISTSELGFMRGGSEAAASLAELFEAGA